MKEPLRDIDIRPALRRHLEREHAGQIFLFVDEFVVCDGEARVDLALLNGAMNGYEIKSERDTLARLPSQQQAYNSCFDKMTAVAASKHISKLQERLPAWWGIMEAKNDDQKQVFFEIVRSPKQNPRINYRRLVGLLWKAEAQGVADTLGVSVNTKNPKRADILQWLVHHAPRPQLKHSVRETIKARGDWRSAPSPFPRGDSSRSSAKSLRFRENRQWLLSRLSQHPLG